MNIVPSIIEVTSRGERTIDVYSKLLRDRTVMLIGEIDDDSSSSVVAQLLHLESVNPEKSIKLLINSNGGSITSGLSIYDTMQYVNPDVETVITGIAASMASVIAQAGAPGKRSIMPNARMMIHQPLGSISGSVSDAEITYKEMLFYKNRIAEIYRDHNTAGHDVEYFMKIMDRDTYFSAEQVVEMGLADGVLMQRPLYG